MSLMGFEPFRSLRDLDRLSSQLMSGTRVPMAMPMDVWREGQTFHVALDVPGVNADEIDLRIERNTLTVSAERRATFAASGPQGQQGSQQATPQSSSGQEHVDVLVAERPQGAFTRQMVLGEGLDPDAVEADYNNGVLHLTIPMAQAAQPRRIQVAQPARGQGGQPQVTSDGQEQPAGS